MLNEVSQMGHDGECLGRKIVVGLLLETLAVWDGVCCLFGLTCHCGIGHSALQHTVIVFCGHAESLAGLGGGRWFKREVLCHEAGCGGWWIGGGRSRTENTCWSLLMLLGR